MLESASASPPAKKVKLTEEEPVDTPEDHEDDTENHCSICLQAMEDRTVIPTCSHEFCFDCLMVWTAQSRRCPLCAQNIGDYLIHEIRSRFDYRKHYLTPLKSNSPEPLLPLRTTAALEARNAIRRRRRDRERRRRHEELDERDKLELSIAFRRWIYKHDLYAKHVASNSFTKYRPYPTPAQFTASPDLISRTTTFLRRELQVWQGLDVEFLTNLIISLMKAIDIRSESAVKLLAEFLDMDTQPDSGNLRANAEHFAHEVYSYVRSPFRDLFVYDSVVQYERPRSASPPPQPRRQMPRWQTGSPGNYEHNDHRSYSPSPRRTEPYGSLLPEQDRGAADLQHSDRSSLLNLGHARYEEQNKVNEPNSRTPKDRTRRRSNSRDERDGGKHMLDSGSPVKGKERENSVVIDRSGHLSPDPSIKGYTCDIPVHAETSTVGPSNCSEPSLHPRFFNGKQEVLEDSPSSLSDVTHASGMRLLGAEEGTRVKRTRPRSLLESIRTHLKPAAATSRSLKKEGGVSRLNPESKGSHDQSTPQRICPSSSIPSTIYKQHRSLDRGDKFGFEGNHSGDSVVGKANLLDPSDVYCTQGKTAPGNVGFHPPTPSALRSAGGDIAPLAQQRTSVPNDGLQGESELVQAEPQISSTLTAGAEQVELRGADLLEFEERPRTLEGIDQYYVQDNRVHQIGNPHVAATPRPAPPMTVPKHENGPPNPDLIMIHQSDMSKPQSRLDDNEKGIREAHKLREGVKEVDRRQSSSIDPLSADDAVATSATEGNPSRGGVRRSMLDCRGIDGETMEYKDVPVLDSTALEASLRKRMRLRAKLAAEKQAAESR